MTFKAKTILYFSIIILSFKFSAAVLAATVTITPNSYTVDNALSTVVSSVTCDDETNVIDIFNPDGSLGASPACADLAGLVGFSLWDDSNGLLNFHTQGSYHALLRLAGGYNYCTLTLSATYASCQADTAVIQDLGTLVTVSSGGEVLGASTSLIPIPDIGNVISSTTPVAATVFGGFGSAIYLVLGTIVAVLIIGFEISVFAKGLKSVLRRRR